MTQPDPHESPGELLSLAEQTRAARSGARTSRGLQLVGVLGELAMTLGVVLLLFVAYQLWWTNLAAHRAAEHAASQLQQEWGRAATDPDAEPAMRPELGSAFALAWIPRLRDSVWGLPVNQGVDDASLSRGLGHYPGTADPGEDGNFAVAGHRATNGEPLRSIDQLEVGDEVIIETKKEWLVYTLTDDLIVTPTDTWVIAPVPGEPDAKPDQALLTITTCHPRWASTERWIWWGELTDRSDKDDVPAAVEEG